MLRLRVGVLLLGLVGLFLAGCAPAPSTSSGGGSTAPRSEKPTTKPKVKAPGDDRG